MKTLREYQVNAVNAIINFTGYGGLVVCPTGAGKSLILSEVCRQLKDKRILVLAHRAELIRQNSIEFKELTGELAGIWSASCNEKTQRRVTFAQIQSAYKNNWSEIDLIIVDECHLIPIKESSMYQTFLEKCKAQLIGLTATPYRMDSGHLVRDKDSLFSKVIYDIPYDQLVADGYLAPIKYKAENGVSNDDFNLKSGEIDQTQVANILEPKLEAILKDATSKQIGKTLWFCPTVEIALKVAWQINGVCIHGESDNREKILADFKDGKIKDITNVEVLTTGFNEPDLRTLVFLRPTKSTALFKQMLGRGTRLAPGKDSCLVLDYTSNTMCHGFLGDDNYPNSKKKNLDYKECPECGFVVKRGTKKCDECNYEWKVFDRGERKPLEKLSEDSFDPNAEWQVTLKSLFAELYYKPDTDRYSIQITMKVNGGSIKKWLPLSEKGRFFLKQFLGKIDLNLEDIITGLTTGREKIEAIIHKINEANSPDFVLARKNGQGYFEFIDFV